MTALLYLENSYLKECEASVVNADGSVVVLDRTILYPQGGGQPSDTGVLTRMSDNTSFKVVLVKKQEGVVIHTTDKPGLSAGDVVRVVVDWEPRYRLMRMHTASHILAAIGHKELGLMITGNQLGVERSRIDFNLENCNREIMQGLVHKANAVIAVGAPVTISSLPREEALKQPGMVKLANALPPSIEVLRIVQMGDVDIQADGGTHVKDIREVGKIIFMSIDNKGKNNRRLYFSLG